MCIGDELAKMILFLYGGRILQNFSISVAEKTVLNLEGDCGITLVPKPHNLIFKRRN